VTAPHENYDATTGLLSTVGLERALDAELARAGRHEIPLSLVYLEVSLAQHDAQRSVDPKVVSRVAEAILASVRAEDRVARIGELRFAVLAVEGDDGETLVRRLREHVRRRLRGGAGQQAAIAVAALDCQFDEMTRTQLMAQVERELERERAGTSSLA
jgi:GGDEF domain-containing protein